MPTAFVDIWHGDILTEVFDSKEYYRYLNMEEKEKSGTFVRSELQKEYIKTRGVLRKILSGYVKEKPETIDIKTAEYGKPYINEALFFNLSHTGNKFVIAVSNVSEVGIDLEQAKPRKNLAGLAKKCFSTEELNYWNELPDAQKIISFYQFWVRKEAFVKAIGRGIAVGLNQCMINPQEQTQFISIPSEYGEVSDWKIVEVSLKQDDVCALVIKDMPFKFKVNEIK